MHMVRVEYYSEDISITIMMIREEYLEQVLTAMFKSGYIVISIGE